ncbi:MAG: hypothetical protein ACJ764_11315 [Solirubrobacteraceae bacterium]
MTSWRRLLHVAAGVLVLVAGGCGGATSQSSTNRVRFTPVYVPAPTTPAAHHAVKSAKVQRDKLLGLAAPGTKVTPRDTVPGWPSANGAAIPATTSQVSGFGFLVDQTKRVQYLGFAVTDAAGHCAGGNIEADLAGKFVLSSARVTIPRHAACTGDEAAKAAGHG